MDSNQPSCQPPSTRNCHSSTQFGQYLIIFGGREGDGKKRIVNDIFIFDTGKYNNQIFIIKKYYSYLFRKTFLVPAEGRQNEIATAAYGPLVASVERQPNHYLWRLEWLFCAIRCHLYRLEKGRRQVELQHSKHNQGRGTDEAIPHIEYHRELDVRFWRWRWQILAQ